MCEQYVSRRQSDVRIMTNGQKINPRPFSSVYNIIYTDIYYIYTYIYLYYVVGREQK